MLTEIIISFIATYDKFYFYNFLNTTHSKLTGRNCMNSTGMRDKIILNFGWMGPSIWQEPKTQCKLDVCAITLIFENTRTNIFVSIPEIVNPKTTRKLPFTCSRQQETEFPIETELTTRQTTQSDQLKVAIERMSTLTVVANIIKELPFTRAFGEKQHQTIYREIKLELPNQWEVGETYLLIVTSTSALLSAYFQKKVKEEDTSLQRETRLPNSFDSQSNPTNKDEPCWQNFQQPLHRMGAFNIESSKILKELNQLEIEQLQRLYNSISKRSEKLKNE